MVLVLAVTWVLFVPAAGWLARHDVGSVKGSLHETALDAARGRLLTLGTGLFAAARCCSLRGTSPCPAKGR